MVRVLKSGTPLFYCAALQDIDDFGDANAEIDDCFTKKLCISKEQYTKDLVSATSDGASVNTGVYNGLLTQLRND